MKKHKFKVGDVLTHKTLGPSGIRAFYRIIGVNKNTYTYIHSLSGYTHECRISFFDKYYKLIPRIKAILWGLED